MKFSALWSVSTRKNTRDPTSITLWKSCKSHCEKTVPVRLYFLTRKSFGSWEGKFQLTWSFCLVCGMLKWAYTCASSYVLSLHCRQHTKFSGGWGDCCISLKYLNIQRLLHDKFQIIPSSPSFQQKNTLISSNQDQKGEAGNKQLSQHIPEYPR